MLFAAAALVVAGLAAGLSQATAPGKNGRIAFSRYELHDTPLTAHIVVANSDGSGQRTITHASRTYHDDHPDWSPDGSRIVFERGCSPNCSRQIWTMRPDGSELRRLSPRCRSGAFCPDDLEARLSPDGRQIAFVSYRGPKTGGYAIWVADANLRHAHRVATGSTPRWSPDGKQLVFVAQPRAVLSVYVCNSDGTGLRRITPLRLKATDHPDWSPDGTRILFAAGPKDRWNLFTIRPDGTGLRQLTHFRGLTRLVVGSYSPDGKSIVFSTVVGAVNPPGSTLTDVFVMTADGRNMRPITRTRNWDGEADWGPQP
jgi:Tol biopolymer transport system component